MGKYSDIVKGKTQPGKPPTDLDLKSRSQGSLHSAPENQKARKPESSKAIKEQNNKTGNVESSNSGERENTITSNAENIITREPENQKAISEDMVNLSIKVPRRLRQKWVAESRLRGTTLTAIISDYLKAELGE